VDGPGDHPGGQLLGLAAVDDHHSFAQQLRDLGGVDLANLFLYPLEKLSSGSAHLVALLTMLSMDVTSESIAAYRGRTPPARPSLSGR